MPPPFRLLLYRLANSSVLRTADIKSLLSRKSDEATSTLG